MFYQGTIQNFGMVVVFNNDLEIPFYLNWSHGTKTKYQWTQNKNKHVLKIVYQQPYGDME